MRSTKGRKKILEFLENSDKAHTAQQVHEQIKDVDLVTVYRNLNKFTEQGLVRELRINRGESMYEINRDGHEHAVCSRCGDVKHINIDKSKLLKALDLADFEVEDIEINIKGHCK